MTGGAHTIGTYKAAREFLLAQRGDYETAYRDFRWPQMEHFNWALDWFDAVLAGLEAREAPLPPGIRGA